MITACSGSGGTVSPVTPVDPVDPIVPITSCIENPDPSTRLPTQNISVDRVFPNYTSPDAQFQIYGYKNPKTIHIKTITVINNYSKTIYPVIYSPTPFTTPEMGITTLSRIFIGRPSCQDQNAFYAGIPPNSSVIAYVPKQMWDAGHVKLFTEAPPFLQEDVKRAIDHPLYTIDTDKASPNYGSLIYTSGTADDFAQELPFQLTEYTIESNCHRNDDPSCATVESDRLTVDYDISAVDQLFLPVAMQESTGSRGYVGTGKTVGDFQKILQDFAKGGDSELSYDSQVGWPLYYGSGGSNGYLNNLIKIPMGYNVLDSLLFPKVSPYNPDPDNPTINSIWVFNKTSQQTVGDQSTLNKVRDQIEARWANFWPGGAGLDPKFNGEFLRTMKFLYDNILVACQYSLTNIPGPGVPLDPALCLSANDPHSILRNIDKIKALVGYTFQSKTFSEPGGQYAAVGTDICKTEPNSVRPNSDAQFYSNCFRDAAKSVQRGVPYPFWEFSEERDYYPELSSIYALNPVVWLVHKKLGLAEYAFSVDDDIGNQELVGKGITLTVGGLKGLRSMNAFDPKLAQTLAFPDGTVIPHWSGTVSGTVPSSSKAILFDACIPGKLGACDLNIQSGGYSSVDVALKGTINDPRVPPVPGVPNPILNFTITAGTPQLCSKGNAKFVPNKPYTDYIYTPLIISKCSTSVGLTNCAANPPRVTFSDEKRSCAQTVNPAKPQP